MINRLSFSPLYVKESLEHETQLHSPLADYLIIVSYSNIPVKVELGVVMELKWA